MIEAWFSRADIIVGDEASLWPDSHSCSYCMFLV